MCVRLLHNPPGLPLTSQAVTSERWLPLLEVGPRDLLAYLGDLRSRGYLVVGVEQAAGSVPLQAFTFPRQCALLLGNEQSGVPQSLMGQLVGCGEGETGRGTGASRNNHGSCGICNGTRRQEY